VSLWEEWLLYVRVVRYVNSMDTLLYARTVKGMLWRLRMLRRIFSAKRKCLSLNKTREIKYTAVWECPNGHWGRVEFIIADGLFEKVSCPVCKSRMALGIRQLEPVRGMVYDDYNRNYSGANKKKGRGKDAKTNSEYRGSIERPCGFES